MKKSTHGRQVGLLAAMALLVIGGGIKTAAAEDISGTVTFATATSQVPGWTKVLENFAKAYPNITVRPNYVPIVTYNQVVSTQFQGGQGPDVVFTSPGSAYPTGIGLLGPAGQIRDLSDLPAVAQLPELAKNVGVLDGKRFALPVAAYSGFFLYNKDKFKELGLQPPETIADLLAMCGTIAGKDLTPVAIGPTDGDLNNFYTLFVASMVQNTDPDWVQQRDANKVTFAGTKGWHQALSAIEDMNKSKCFDWGVAGMSRAAATASFVQGKALMIPILQPQLAAIMAAKPTFAWGAFPAPGQTPDQQTMFVEVSPLFSVNAKPVNEAATLAFMNFIMQPEQTTTYAEAQGVISTGQLAEKKLPEYLAPYAKYMFKSGTPPHLVTTQFKTPATYGVLSKGLVGLLTGQTKVDDLLAKMDETYGQK